MFNNDQNYNNGNPLFNNTNNNFNNGITSNNPQGQYNNYNSQNIGQNPFETSGFAPNSNFIMNQIPDQNMMSESNNFMNGYNNTSPVNDVPPDLGEIKNLSEATVSTAPTMDVLGPMNVMPDTLPTNNDLLDAYENGSINVNNNLSNNNITSNSQTLNPLSQMNVSNNLNMFQNISEPPQMNNFPNSTMTQSNNYESIPQNNAIQSNFNTNIPHSNLTSNEYNNVNVGSTVNLNNGYNNSLSNDFNFQPNSSQSQLNNLNIQPMSESNVNQDVLAPVNNIASNNNFEPEKSVLEEKTEQVVPEITNEENDYSIIQNKDLTDNQDSSTNVTDLGLDESYTETDTLEIMDIENEDETEVPAENENVTLTKETQNIEPGSISKCVDKIKELLEEIKASGIDIELEEFDFESMYQLVVKINK